MPPKKKKSIPKKKAKVSLSAKKSVSKKSPVKKKKVQKKSIGKGKEKQEKNTVEKKLDTVIDEAKIEKDLFDVIPKKYRGRIKKLVTQCKEQGYVVTDVLEKHLSLDECDNQPDVWGCIENIFRHSCVDIVEESGLLQEIKSETDTRFADIDPTSYDSIQMYLRDIGKYSLLSAQEEVELSKKIKEYTLLINKKSKKKYTPKEKRQLIQEGIKSRDKLATSNLRLVVSIAKNYSGRTQSLSLLDLVHEGTKGLYKAVDKFDEARGFKFSTYATWWIKQAVVRGLADKSRTIRVPVHMSETSQRCEKTAIYLEQVLGRQPTIQELAEELDMEPERIHMIRRISQDVVQLDRPIGGDGGDGGETRVVETIEDDTIEGQESITAREILKNHIHQILDELTPRERQVVELRHGMKDGVQYTLEEIGKKLGVTRERVRQIEAKALERMQGSDRVKQLRNF